MKLDWLVFEQHFVINHRNLREDCMTCANKARGHHFADLPGEYDRMKRKDPRKAAELAFALAMLYGQPYATECQEIMRGLLYQTLEQCAPHSISVNGVQFPNLFHPGTVEMAFKRGLGRYRPCPPRIKHLDVCPEEFEEVRRRDPRLALEWALVLCRMKSLDGPKRSFYLRACRQLLRQCNPQTLEECLPRLQPVVHGLNMPNYIHAGTVEPIIGRYR